LLLCHYTLPFIALHGTPSRDLPRYICRLRCRLPHIYAMPTRGSILLCRRVHVPVTCVTHATTHLLDTFIHCCYVYYRTDFVDFIYWLPRLYRCCCRLLHCFVAIGTTGYAYRIPHSTVGLRYVPVARTHLHTHGTFTHTHSPLRVPYLLIRTIHLPVHLGYGLPYARLRAHTRCCRCYDTHTLLPHILYSTHTTTAPVTGYVTVTGLRFILRTGLFRGYLRLFATHYPAVVDLHSPLTLPHQYGYLPITRCYIYTGYLRRYLHISVYRCPFLIRGCSGTLDTTHTLLRLFPLHAFGHFAFICYRYGAYLVVYL